MVINTIPDTMNGKQMVDLIVTSAKVDKDIWKKAKVAAIEQEIPLWQFLNEGLEMRLAQVRKPKQ